MKTLNKSILVTLLLIGNINLVSSQVRCGLQCANGAFIGCEGVYSCEASTGGGYVYCDGGSTSQAFCN